MHLDQEPRSGEYIQAGPAPQAQGWQTFRTRVVSVPASRTFGFGSMLAITISYVHNQSIGWAILHGLLSWFFVIYAALFY